MKFDLKLLLKDKHHWQQIVSKQIQAKPNAAMKFNDFCKN